MTADSAAPRESAFRRGRLAFRRWRRTRPFWGGLFLILSGAEILYSGNRDLGSLQVHVGLAGFQSYLIPLVLILCGALVWFTPAQRVFYGVIGLAVAIYSLVGANLGGFLLGFLLGLFGGGLSLAWIPVKRKGAAVAADAEPPDDGGDVRESQGLDVMDPGDEATTGPLQDTLPTAARSPLLPAQHTAPDQESTEDPSPTSSDTTAAAASDPAATEDEEGEQRSGFPGPRHAAREPEVAGSDLETGDEPEGLASRLRKSPRGPIALIAVLSLGTLALVTLPSQPSAAAQTCASPAYQRVLQKMGVAGSTSPRTKSKTPASAGAAAKPGSGVANTSGGTGPAAHSATTPATTPAPQQAGSSPSPSPSTSAGPVGSLLNVVGGLLNSANQLAAGSTDAPTPSSAPTTNPSPSSSPTSTASPTPTPKPTADPTSKPAPTGKPATKPITPLKPSSASQSPSPICSAITKSSVTINAKYVNEQPSKMTTADLTMLGLSYDGLADLPLKNSGTLTALHFSMSSSTSTPFELQPAVGSHSIDIKSSQLTVSGNVEFFCTSISGNVAVAGIGLVPVTFDVASPPPAVLSDMEFTDVTIQLAYVQSDVLTANALDISTT